MRLIVYFICTSCWTENDLIFLCNLDQSTNLEKAHPDVLLDACLAPNERGVDTVILGDAVDHDFQ